ncbi:MAG TPA: VOC family protein [Actinomycetota bacterium]|nr:VOC family protein [Actinomycetota bacterium]
MSIRPERVGHVVLKVRSLARSVPFYTDVLGFKENARYGGRMAFFTATGENHHDLALMEIGDSAASAAPNAVGLFHVAIRLPSVDAVRDAYKTLRARGIPVGSSDHGVSKSIYLEDPDGIEIELYADEPAESYNGDVASAMTVRGWNPEA